jgi:molybdopterin adenylyltransferase
MGVRNAAVITLSDGAANGLRIDKSGELLANLATESGFTVTDKIIIPDDFSTIISTLTDLCDADANKVNLILTTGGTGLGPRDVTPEATLAVVERTIPGIAEAMRAEGLKKTPMAMTSRQTVGVRGSTLIINFPGSPKAVQEGFAVVAPVLHHVLDLMEGNTEHKK